MIARTAKPDAHTICPMKSIDQIKNLLAGRPVLVTGADGFVGSALVPTLIDFGARVHVLVRATSSGALHNIGDRKNELQVHRGDLTDRTAVARTLHALPKDGEKPIIFHLGAQAHVGESWGRPFETVYTNVVGTLNLLQCIVDLGIEIYSLDVAGSSEEYGNVIEEVRSHYRFDEGGGLILDERSPLNPQSPYATAKVAADFLTRDFHKAYGVPAVVSRMFNNYGPRQNPRFVTATIITQALSRDEVRLGYLASKRDFCFVRDGAMGHIHAALFGKPGEVYVFGYGRSISISDWFEMIMRIGRDKGLWGAKRLHIESARGRLGNSEVEELRVDYSRLHSTSGWEPQYTWEAGLEETIRWYAEHRDRWISRVDW